MWLRQVVRPLRRAAKLMVLNLARGIEKASRQGLTCHAAPASPARVSKSCGREIVSGIKWGYSDLKRLDVPTTKRLQG
jgi:hypothetical protein